MAAPFARFRLAIRSGRLRAAGRLNCWLCCGFSRLESTMSDGRACWLVVVALGYVQGRDTRLIFVSAAVLSVVGPLERLLLLVVVLAVSARVVWWHISQGEEEGTSGRQEVRPAIPHEN